MKSKAIPRLEYIPLITGIEPKLINLLCRKAAYTRLIKQGEALFKQGDISEFLFVIREGSFKSVWINENGKEIILQIAWKGEMIATNSIEQSSRHLASAIALEDSSVCIISREKLEEVIRDSPDVALQLICNLGNRVHQLSQQVTEFRIGSTRERVFHLLARLASQNGEPYGKGTKIKTRLTQQEIANFVGASRVMVSQSLQELLSSNYITRENNHYIINDHIIDNCRA
jgi:CRP/FNR family transcriptional regulator